MKYLHKPIWVCAWIVAVGLSLHLLGENSLAAEGSKSWRPTYDLIMRWVNFGIIVFLANKYAKAPVLNFLKGRGNQVAEQIKALEDKRDEAAEKIRETQKFIEESEVRFADLREFIVQQGEKKKQDLIASAQEQSRLLLEDSKRRVQSYILEARNAFKAEMIDAAIDLAMERLPKEITAADNQKILDEYLAGTMTQ